MTFKKRVLIKTMEKTINTARKQNKINEFINYILKNEETLEITIGELIQLELLKPSELARVFEENIK